MQNVKEKVKSLIDILPDDSTIEDIMEHLYIKQKIMKAQKEIENGNFYTHEEAKEQIRNDSMGRNANCT